jgi:hypothetical protein
MKKRKAFLYGFLVLAMITLLSGIIQAEKMVFKTTYYEQLAYNPPGNVPTVNVLVCNEMTFPVLVETSILNTWYCTINPGYVICASVSIDDAILYTDMQSMDYMYLYKLNNCSYASQSFKCKESVIRFRLPRDGLRES